VAVAIHGRTRAQGFSGHVDHSGIRQVVEAVESIPVIGNGDVRTVPDAARMFAETGCTGVSVGRGALANPWIFSQIIEFTEGREAQRPSARERAELVEKHLELMIRTFPNPHFTVHLLKKYLCAYATGLRGASSFRKHIQRSSDLDELVEDAKRFFRETE